EIDQNDDDNDLAKERELLASLIEKLKCEIDESKNRNKFLETSNKVLIEKLKELARLNSKEYASQMEFKCAKVREMKDKLSAHQETISILSKQKEAQIKLYKPREDKELDKSLTPDSDEVIRLEKESRSKLSDLIRPFDYDKLDNLYDLFVPQREKSSEQRYFLERSRLSHTNVNNGKSKESFHKQTNLLEKRMDESIKLDKQCQSSLENFKVKSYVNMIITGVELCKQKIANKTGLNEEMVADLRFFNSLELEVDSLRSQLETQKTQFLNEIDRLSREYYYVDHMNAILGVYTELDEVTNLQFTAQTLPPNKKSILKNTNVLAPRMYKLHTNHNQARTSQPTLKSNPMGDRVMRNNSRGKKQEVKDQSRNVNLPKNKKPVTACNDSLNAKTLNVKYVYAMCDKCVLINKHDMCVLNSVSKPIKRTAASESNQKSRNITRKQYERVSKTCSWWRSTVSNTPLSSNSFVARRDCPIHR
nr:hypothetical protein [Tanacetum cinerariifolium]